MSKENTNGEVERVINVVMERIEVAGEQTGSMSEEKTKWWWRQIEMSRRSGGGVD